MSDGVGLGERIWTEFIIPIQFCTIQPKAVGDGWGFRSLHESDWPGVGCIFSQVVPPWALDVLVLGG